MFYDLFEDDVLADDCANVVPDLSRLLSDDEKGEHRTKPVRHAA